MPPGKVRGVSEILLINPNTSLATTAMMIGIANSVSPNGLSIRGATAAHGTTMIVNESELVASANEVVRIGRSEAAQVAGIVVGAFGDPGLDVLRRELTIPVTGLCEAAMLEAAFDQRRFGIATTTPDLVAALSAKATAAGFSDLFTGIRLTPGDPRELTRDADRLDTALEAAIRDCVELDGAQAVIIGGGPLAQAASRLAPRFDAPIIEPIPAAIRRLVDAIFEGDSKP